MENENEDTDCVVPRTTNSPDYGASFSCYRRQETCIYSFLIKLLNFVDMDSLCIRKS